MKISSKIFKNMSRSISGAARHTKLLFKCDFEFGKQELSYK